MTSTTAAQERADAERAKLQIETKRVQLDGANNDLCNEQARWEIEHSRVQAIKEKALVQLLLKNARRTDDQTALFNCLYADHRHTVLITEEKLHAPSSLWSSMDLDACSCQHSHPLGVLVDWLKYEIIWPITAVTVTGDNPNAHNEGLT
jgi:hypothetical protein